MTFHVKVKFAEISKKLEVSFSEITQNLAVTFSDNSNKLPVKFGDFQTITEYVGGELYQGDYTATPKVEAQTMPTKEKVMLDDVTIHAIPIYTVSNNSGGNTVYIAKEI